MVSGNLGNAGSAMMIDTLIALSVFLNCLCAVVSATLLFKSTTTVFRLVFISSKMQARFGLLPS